MLRKWQKRLWVIAFFIGFNIVLGSYFLLEVEAELPSPIMDIINDWHTEKPTHLAVIDQSVPIVVEVPDLSSASLINKINEHRETQNLKKLNEDSSLNKAADELLTTILDSSTNDEFKIDDEKLKAIVSESGYEFERMYQHLLSGPKMVESVWVSWKTDEDQLEIIVSPEIVDVGVANRIVKAKNGKEIGVVLSLFGKKKASVDRANGVIQSKNYTPQTREIPDDEVMTALNNYRENHGLYKLEIDSRLCQYAEKRAQDLKAFGGLDGHAGFKQDFSNQENLPVGIKDYPRGNKFSENLAHQYCKNMTTGESFIAQTGTALIEWCFDSSTRGHREAQLSRESKNFCVRHADNMYVVIFGT